MRTFMAFEISKEIGQKLSEIQENLKSNDFLGNWPSIDNTHLTLFFFGNIDEKKILKIEKTMDECVTKFKKFFISVENIGLFPPKGLPRVVWMGCKGKEIYEIYRIMNDLLKKDGFSFDDHFTPHLTVGRIKGLPKEWNEVVSQIRYDPLTYRCEEITLFSSTLTPEGSTYRSIHKSKLGG